MSKHTLSTEMVPDWNDPERNVWQGKCSCGNWVTTQIWKSNIVDAFNNKHMAREYRAALAKIADLVYEGEQRVGALAWDPAQTSNYLLMAQVRGGVIDEIGDIIDDLDGTLFDESGKKP